MTDCPICHSLRSVDDDGYCNACGKMVPPGRMLAARWEHGLPRSVSAVERCRAAPPALSGRWHIDHPGHCKLTPIDVLRIRQWPLDHPEDSIRSIVALLSGYYHVDRSTIRDVLLRRSWQGLLEERL